MPARRPATWRRPGLTRWSSGEDSTCSPRFSSLLYDACRPGRVPGLHGSVTDRVGDVLLIFQADVVEQLRIELDRMRELDRPRRGVRLGVIDGQFDFELA